MVGRRAALWVGAWAWLEFVGEGVLIGLATGYDAGGAYAAIVEGSRR